MKTKHINKVILFIIFLASRIIATNHFTYKSIIENFEKNEIIITLQFNTEKNIYINNETIKCQINSNEDIGIIKTEDVIGNIYLKDNKKSFQALSGSGSMTCIFENKNKIINTLEINYILFNAKTNALTEHKEIIPLPQSNKKKEINNKKTIENKNTEKSIADNSFLDMIINKTKNSHFLLIAFFTFILGVLMSLTPCIYPMIPITISILGIDKKSFSARLYSGILYMLGISITFSILGILAASGKLFFGQLLAMPLFTGITTFILFFMTLQMLGLIDSIISINNNFKMPRFLENHRYLPFFYGIFSGTITSPCVSPGLIAILSLVGQQNNIFIGWLWLFTFGIGLSLPLLLIALVMNSAFIFPKSGDWMNELKEIIGLSLIYILKTNITRLINYDIAFIISSSMIFIFLIYKYHWHHNSKNNYKHWLFSFSSIGAVILLLFFIISFQKQKTPASTPTKTQIEWADSFDNTIINQAIETNKLLLIDFTADWCSICQVVHKEIFSDNSFMEKIKKYYLFCKIDCTETDQTKELLLKKYKINGFPSILIINPKTQKIMKRYSGEILNVAQPNFIAQSEELHNKIQ